MGRFTDEQLRQIVADGQRSDDETVRWHGDLAADVLDARAEVGKVTKWYADAKRNLAMDAALAQENDQPSQKDDWYPKDVHTWFGLTYANYLVMPRALLQSMPDDWQEPFARLLWEWETTLSMNRVPLPSYRVQAVDDRGRFMADPIPHYNRGRTRIDLSAQMDEEDE